MADISDVRIACMHSFKNLFVECVKHANKNFAQIGTQQSGLDEVS